MAIVGLSGFMGSGKSTLGRKVAKENGYIHRDVDTEIEEDIGPIGTFIDQYGINSFRSIESSKVSDILDETPDTEDLILSSGGGMVTISENVQMFQEKGVYNIHLKSTFETLLSRIRNDEKGSTNRVNMTDKQLHELFMSRVDIYKEASDEVIVNEGTIKEAVDMIINECDYFSEIKPLRDIIDTKDNQLMSLIQDPGNNISSYKDLLDNTQARIYLKERNACADPMPDIKGRYGKTLLDIKRMQKVRDRWKNQLGELGQVIYQQLHDDTVKRERAHRN